MKYYKANGYVIKNYIENFLLEDKNELSENENNQENKDKNKVCEFIYDSE